MAFINRVCDKVFVINQEKDKKRLDAFDEYMMLNEIKYERFKGVDGKKVVRDSRLTDYCNTFCTDGMKGCALSHRSIWDIMIENGYKNIFIFEDDAVLNDTFDRDFQHVWNFLPKDYDIVYFGCLFGCTDTSLVNNMYKKIYGIDTEEVNEYIHTSKGSTGLHGYMLSLEGAKKLASNPIDSHVDSQIMTWIKTYNYVAYAANPNMVDTSQGKSSLSDKYPVLLNSILQKIPLNNLNKPTTLDWSLNENFIKLGWFNINPLLLICMAIVILLPIKYYYAIFIWLSLELFISLDFKNTFRYLVFLGLPISLKIYYIKK